MSKLFVLLALIGTAYCNTTTVTRCNNQASLPLNAYVEGCPTPPCGLPQLSDAIVHLVFESPRVIKNLQARATAYLSILPIQYPLGDQEDACRGLTNSYCPLLKGEVLQYTLRMYIEPFFPVGVAPNLEFSLVDGDTNETIVCIRLGIRVDPALESRASNTTSIA